MQPDQGLNTVAKCTIEGQTEVLSTADVFSTMRWIKLYMSLFNLFIWHKMALVFFYAYYIRREKQQITPRLEKKHKRTWKEESCIFFWHFLCTPDSPLHPLPSSLHFHFHSSLPLLSALTSSLISPGKSALNKRSHCLWCSSLRF